jgi:putative ABC transport system permease protein
MDIGGGALLAGRFFNQTELRTGSPVAVIEETTARRLMGPRNPIGQRVRIGGRPLKIIGLYQLPDNIFQPPTQEIGAIIPYETGHRYFRYDDTNALWIVARPKPGVTVAEAQDAVTVTMRRLRGLHPGDPDTFDLITQDQILDVFNKLTGVFFLVMVVL